MSARYYGLFLDLKITLRSLEAPLRRHMQSVGETLDLLLVAHFPNSVVTEVVEAPAAEPNFWIGGWMRGLSLIGQGKGQFIFYPI